MEIGTLASTCEQIERWAATNRKELGGDVDFDAVMQVTMLARQAWFDAKRRGRVTQGD